MPVVFPCFCFLSVYEKSHIICLLPLFSLTLSAHFFFFFFPSVWRISTGRLSTPLCALKPHSALREACQATLVWGHLDHSALTVTGPENLLAPHTLNRIMHPGLQRKDPINGVDSTCRQLPRRYFSTVRLISTAKLWSSKGLMPLSSSRLLKVIMVLGLLNHLRVVSAQVGAELRGLSNS